MTAFTSSTDSPAYCHQPCASSMSNSSFASPVLLSLLWALPLTMRALLETYISHSMSLDMCFPLSLSPTNRCEERRGEEVTEDTSPDVGPPPNSHWPTERAPDDGGSLPRPHAEPAALRAAGLSEGEEAGADEREREYKLFRAGRLLGIFQSNRCKHSVVLMF